MHCPRHVQVCAPLPPATPQATDSEGPLHLVTMPESALAQALEEGCMYSPACHRTTCLPSKMQPCMSAACPLQAASDASLPFAAPSSQPGAASGRWPPHVSPADAANTAFRLLQLVLHDTGNERYIQLLLTPSFTVTQCLCWMAIM